MVDVFKEAIISHLHHTKDMFISLAKKEPCGKRMNAGGRSQDLCQMGGKTQPIQDIVRQLTGRILRGNITLMKKELSHIFLFDQPWFIRLLYVCITFFNSSKPVHISKTILELSVVCFFGLFKVDLSFSLFLEQQNHPPIFLP
jgi:hypothetical protein